MLILVRNLFLAGWEMMEPSGWRMSWSVSESRPSIQGDGSKSMDKTGFLRRVNLSSAEMLVSPKSVHQPVYVRKKVNDEEAEQSIPESRPKNQLKMVGIQRRKAGFLRQIDVVLFRYGAGPSPMSPDSDCHDTCALTVV
ncbi:hypothetical protein N7460_008577 [Penicillium canescens]|uniref:Uncharacterized protein n=1 Tax=Penicillium canescens TaxID=5083 RepID=A0AAD6N6B7_PENCN|nr:hypothetical protein N7460_008577 [Penicillium canescens]